MPVTQTDHHNTDMTEILLALRLEDFDLAPVLEAVEDLQLDAGRADDDGFVSRGHLDEDDYLTLDVTPVFQGQNGTAYTLIIVTPPSVSNNLVWQKHLKEEILDAIHGKASASSGVRISSPRSSAM